MENVLTSSGAGRSGVSGGSPSTRHARKKQSAADVISTARLIIRYSFHSLDGQTTCIVAGERSDCQWECRRIGCPHPGRSCAMDEYVCITVLSRPSEGQGEFAARLSRFWTQMLRQCKADFEKVYAETTVFEECENGWSRQYLAELDIVVLLESELNTAGNTFDAIYRHEGFSKEEAGPTGRRQNHHVCGTSPPCLRG